jgi:hypothetical protein
MELVLDGLPLRGQNFLLFDELLPIRVDDA